jgi:predicted NBD/HSP70 family sugar kinase
MEKLFKNTAGKSLVVESKNILNKKLILKFIYFNGPLSNSELAKLIQLSTPKINLLLGELIQDGLVEELGIGDSSGGRRPLIYGLVKNGFYVVGITININRTVISIFNSNGELVSGPHYFSIKMQSELSIFNKVNDALNEVIQTNNIPQNKLLVAGIELPGLIDLKEGVNKTYFPRTKNLFGELRKIFGIPVYFNHDAKIRAFAEQHFGLAKNLKNVLLLQADWGLGLGIIVKGKLYSGKSGFSGEFGHLPIVDKGILCSCGKQGCLETMVSAVAITRMAKEGIQNGQLSLIKELVKNNLENIDISIVIQAANQGDQFAISIFSEAGYWLGRGMAYLIQIFNPELIIVGGRVAEARQFILAPIQQAIHTFSNPDISNDTEIKFSELGANAGTVGIAAYALEKLAMEK